MGDVLASESRDGCAPLDGQCDAGEVAGVVGEQEDRDVADILWLCMMTERDGAFRTFDRFGGREGPRGHGGIDAARTDAIRAHTMRAVLHGEQTSERVDATFACRVARAETVTADRGG